MSCEILSRDGNSLKMKLFDKKETELTVNEINVLKFDATYAGKNNDLRNNK